MAEAIIAATNQDLGGFIAEGKFYGDLYGLLIGTLSQNTMKNVITEQKNKRDDLNCFSCRHFFITYDPKFPYGCRAVGFKSRWMPSLEMYVNSGIDCQFFSRKGGAE